MTKSSITDLIILSLNTLTVPIKRSLSHAETTNVEFIKGILNLNFESKTLLKT